MAARATRIQFNFLLGDDTIEEIDSTPTGNWRVWKTITKTVSLDQGAQTMLIESTGGNWKINWIRFERIGDSNLSDKSNKTLSDTNLIIYPNPSTYGMFTLPNSGKWVIFSANGVSIKNGEGTDINLSGFTKGMYFVKMKDGTGAVRKIIYR